MILLSNCNTMSTFAQCLATRKASLSSRRLGRWIAILCFLTTIFKITITKCFVRLLFADCHYFYSANFPRYVRSHKIIPWIYTDLWINVSILIMDFLIPSQSVLMNFWFGLTFLLTQILLLKFRMLKKFQS